MTNTNVLDSVSAMAKRRGYIYPSSEIYGGLANTYDFGPYGTELKENVRRLWWDRFVRSRQDMFGIDSSIIINPSVWEASGHVAAFGDIMVEDKVTRKRYRADHIIEDFAETADISEDEKHELRKVDGKPANELQAIIEKYSIKSPDGNDFTQARKFNQLFETSIGIIEGDKNKAYLRGEIAQGLFINYPNILDSMHPKLPFGIAQAGKAFRNEITKGQFTFRTLEFDLMEFEYFFDPDNQNWNDLFEYWKSEIEDFALSCGIKKDNIRWRPHEEFELSHYSKRTEDLEYNFPWGFKEMFACAYRTDFDLANHSKNSGKDLSYRRDDGSKVIPHVIEPTFGLSRFITILLMDAYREEEINGKKRTVLGLSPKIAPVKAAIFPLQKDEKLLELARNLHKSLLTDFNCELENKGNIGKMYRRHDEIGTPFCITVDYDSLQDLSVTIRDRDTMQQTRIKLDEVKQYINNRIQ
ncbi:glycine--tRNA ligase [Candidatus Dojkabacteria bacterium]|uniref:glycine--tRNA ligase n=2 Tax=Candidatus Dojkabacteria TaxID=74243 RepID=A0A136KLH1_9BACT|nr:MAG: Glycine--tRNA ligase [candidate division WS6 bacterium OLB21]MBW7953720.1 glycine--tRNA ligase [Candidatus Dojkabacteria bacterium]